MGGRGGASSRGSAKMKMLSVNTGNGWISYREYGGKTYAIGQGNAPSGSGIAKSLSSIKKNAERLGFKVKTYNSKEYAKYEEAYKKDREATEKFLNEQWYRAAPRPRHGLKGH